MQVLLLGGRGMLGSDLADLGLSREHQVIVWDRDEYTVARNSILRIPNGTDWVVNCAAYTAVDRAESEEELAYETNAIGVVPIRDACRQSGARLLHISTDYVFNGRAETPYKEHSPTDPLNVYGKTKLFGEGLALQAGAENIVVRTSWLYGSRGPSFPRTMLRLALERDELSVVSDQVGRPTYTRSLADRLWTLMEIGPFPGIYHLAGSEVMSWHEFALRIFDAAREALGERFSVPKVNAILTDAYPTPAQRPLYSVMDLSKVTEVGVPPLPSTSEELSSFIRELVERKVEPLDRFS